MSDVEKVARAIRVGCVVSDAHLTCAYPDCECQSLPRAIAAAIAAMDGWQDISAAPRDGTEVDLWIGGARCTECRWDSEIPTYGQEGEYVHDGSWRRLEHDPVSGEPTHFKYISAPPQHGGE